MKHIVALVDFSDLTFKVLKHAHALAKAFNSEVTILHVQTRHPVVVDAGIVAPMIMEGPSAEAVLKQAAQLEEMRDSLVKFGVSANVKQLDGDRVQDLLAVTRKLEADLIIVGSHHHGAFYNMLIGSVTSDILKLAHCPVLVVPSDDVALEKK